MIGIFLQGLKPMRETPAKAAQLCQANDIRAIAMFAVQQGPKGLQNVGGKPGVIDTPETMARYADAFRKAKIDIWVWGYPWAGREEEFLDAMAKADKLVNARGWILDPEKPYKGKKGPDQMRALMDGARERTKGCLAFTSFGVAKFHPTFPWKVAGSGEYELDAVIPQLYLPEIRDSKKADAMVDRSVLEWRDIFNASSQMMQPAVPAFGDNSGARLHDFLSFFIDNEEHYNIGGFWVWSWPQIDAGEWRILKRWAGWFKTGAVGE